MPPYTWTSLLAVAIAAGIDLGVLRTRLLRRRAFWSAYAIVLFFQLVVNGLLTGLDIVRYDPARILGPRVVFAPVEDLFFGFALVLLTLTLWVWCGRRAAPTPPRADRAAPPPPAAPAPPARGR